MKSLLLSVFATLILWAPAADADRRADCAKAKQQIRKLQSRMRQGYSAKQGVRWKAELRRLRKIRAKSCR